MNQTVWMVVSASLAVGLVAGYFMHRSDYCLAGAFRDMFLFRSVDRLGSLVLLVTISALLFETFRLSGWLPAYPFPWFSPPSLTNVLGGLMFGVGMVLAGGCVVGVLYKLGGGSLLAAIAIFGLVVGSGLYAELHPVWLRLAEQIKLHDSAVTIPQLTATDPVFWMFAVVIPGSFISWKWLNKYQTNRKNRAEGFVPLWMTASVLAVLGLASVMTTTIPMGVSTSYAKAAATVESVFIPEHVANTPFYAARQASLIFPGHAENISGGGGPQWDVIAMVQYPLMLGIVLGALISAKLLGEFRIYWQVPRRQLVMVFFGGMIMGLGARMAPGCNVWHLLGGLPILTIQSILFIVGMVAGAWCGTMMLKRVLA